MASVIWRRGIRLLLAACVAAGMLALAIYRAHVPPATPPAYGGPRPEPSPDGFVTHRESILIDVPLDRYLAWSASVPLASILPGTGAIPRVIATEPVSGEWGEAGARRRVILEDGHYAAEEILQSDEPGVFRYQVWGYTNLARLLCAYAIGEFQQVEAGGSTRVTWTYAFQPTTGLARPLLVRFVEDVWSGYMRMVIRTMRADAERFAGKASSGRPDEDEPLTWSRTISS